MISRTQQKGVIIGVMWSMIAWIPYYTDFLSSLRGIIGIPAALGINLEMALSHGDAFVYSILLGTGIGFFIGTVMNFIKNGVKIIGLFSNKKKRLPRRGY